MKNFMIPYRPHPTKAIPSQELIYDAPQAPPIRTLVVGRVWQQYLGSHVAMRSTAGGE